MKLTDEMVWMTYYKTLLTTMEQSKYNSPSVLANDADTALAEHRKRFPLLTDTGMEGWDKGGWG